MVLEYLIALLENDTSALNVHHAILHNICTVIYWGTPNPIPYFFMAVGSILLSFVLQ